ncbi:MAG: DUF7570 family protein [Bacilli bacterium]
MSIVKDVPYVYETEKDLAVGVQIKNMINPYIRFRMERFVETCQEKGTRIYVPDEFIDTIETGCKHLLESADIKTRKTLAREHIVNYIISEFTTDVLLKPKHEFKVK